jgi:flagellar hook-length control protein FliK
MTEVARIAPTTAAAHASSAAVAARTPSATAGGADDAQGAEASFGELLEAGMGKFVKEDAKSKVAPTTGAPDKDSHEVPGVDPGALLSQITPAAVPQATPAQVPGLIAPFTPEGRPTARDAHETGTLAKPGIAHGEMPRAAPEAAPELGRMPRDEEPQAREAFRAPPSDFAPTSVPAVERGEKPVPELRAKASPVQAPDVPVQGLLSSHRPAETASARIEAIPQPVGTPAWDDALSGRVVWMAKNDVQSAEIRLNPEELGPVEVRLSLSGDQNGTATVQFSAAQGATREAIEAALPRLREMFEASGISLGNASVDAGNAGQAGNPGEFVKATRGESGHRPEGPPDAAGELHLPRPVKRGNGLVDTFA